MKSGIQSYCRGIEPLVLRVLRALRGKTQIAIGCGLQSRAGKSDAVPDDPGKAFSDDPVESTWLMPPVGHQHSHALLIRGQSRSQRLVC